MISTVAQLIQSTIDSTLFYVLLREGIAMVRYHPKAPDGSRYTLESLNKDVRAQLSGLVERKEWLYLDSPIKNRRNTCVHFSGLVTTEIDLTKTPIKVYGKADGLPARSVYIINDDKGQNLFASERDSILVSMTQRIDLSRTHPAY
jgi:hypothetical protein